MNKERVTVVYELLKYFLVNKHSSSESIIQSLPFSEHEIRKGLELLKKNEFVFSYGAEDYYINQNVTYMISQMIRAHDDLHGKWVI
ncbi:hypothetical protein [Ferdinandcohnia sp. SAFN-114]|uniref:hypothetical protein n=1 Tax=Ferdinandcohnia sp. SAFN-114 TaxID=3387275 RepID=UPI003F81939D